MHRGFQGYLFVLLLYSPVLRLGSQEVLKLSIYS